MSNNTINHVSDSSAYVTFDPTNTQWPGTVKTVQDALSALGSWSRVDVGLPTASEAVAGISKIATVVDIDAGTDNTKYVTPRLLAYRLGNPHASQLAWGYTKYATDAEALTITNDLVSLTPRSFDYAMNVRRATETVSGSTRLSTTPQAVAGLDDTTSMTPLKVKQAISALVPVQSNATESITGLVRLATVAQVRGGAIRDGFAISPYTFARLTASYTDLGVVQTATQAEVAAGFDQQKYVTPWTLNTTRGNANQFGVVRLSTDINASLANTALSAQANVIPSNRSSLLTGGDIYRDNWDISNKYQTRAEVEQNIPIGGIIMVAFYSDYGNMLICNGRALNRYTYPVLFSRIGYTYGGGGDWFNIPDFRGLAPRGWDEGRGMDPGRGLGTYQGDQIAWHEHQLQMIFSAGGGLPSWQALYELKGAEKNDQQIYSLDQQFSKAKGFGGNETRMKNLAIPFAIRVI